MKIWISSLAWFVLFVGTINSFAQPRQNTYFVKNSGKYVQSLDSADYYRVVREPDSGSVLYNVFEFYKSRVPKLLGKSSKIDYLSLEGQCVEYFPSGVKKAISVYKEGRKDGDSFVFYPNGKLYAQLRYSVKEPYTGDDFLIIACNDSTGRTLVEDGNGYFIGYNDDFKRIDEEGAVKLGARDGNWKGSNNYKANLVTFFEKYDSGKLIEGYSVDSAGVKTSYKFRRRAPEFKGGEAAFDRFLENNIFYPSKARRNNIQGTVLCSFVVEKDGSLTDVKVNHSPGEDLSAEAIRVLKRSPKWLPGYQYGIPVRVSYTVPINFSLGN